MDDFNSKSRTQGAVGSERMQLLCIIAHYWDELDRYEFEGGSQRQKWDLWDTITHEFNNLPNISVIRTPVQVKTLFKNMKTKARKYKKKIEESKSLGVGVVIETDPISETVLQLNRYQSKEVLKSVLEPLKSMYYLSQRSNLPLFALSEKLEDGKFALKSGLTSALANMYGNNETMGDDCYENSSDSSYVGKESSPPRETSKTSPVNAVHTFGDISVTPIVRSKSNQSASFSFTPKYNRSLPPETASGNSKEFYPIKRPLFDESSSQSPAKISKKSENVSLPNGLSDLNSSSLPKKFCCNDFASELLDLAKKEHELSLRLLRESILVQKTKRELHEEERKIQEQEFLLRQQEMHSSIAERQAKLKVIELECKIQEAKYNHSSKTSKWFHHNKSKEI